MRLILVLAVLASFAIPGYCGPVNFGFSNNSLSVLVFNGDNVDAGAAGPNDDYISLFTGSGVGAGVGRFGINLGAAPTGLEGLNGAIFGGPWLVSGYTDVAGVETATLTAPTSTMFVYDTVGAFSGLAAKADVTFDRIKVDRNASGTLSAIVSINIGPWTQDGVGSLSAPLQELLAATPARGIATLSFNLPGVSSLSVLMGQLNNNVDLVGFTGNVSHVPEPGFYGMLAAGLGSLVWVFRRRKLDEA